jgi:hypothetical protein
MAEYNLNPTSGNILNRYASYTYNFKLYAVSKDAYNAISKQSVDFNEIHKSGYIKSSPRAIIAESGVTNLKIDDVSITSRPSTTDATYITNLGFKVTQPKGFSFIESMVAAGTMCGWEGFFSSPFLIFEISFKGWDGNSGDARTAQVISIPIQITNVNTEIDGGGSRYSIDAAVLFNSNRQAYNSTLGAMTIDACDNFGTFLSKFETALNEEAKKDKSNGDVLTTTHKFETTEDIRAIKLNAPTDPSNVLFNRSANRENGGGSGASYSISSQMTIPKILESVLITSKEFQKQLSREGDEPNKIFGLAFQIDPKIDIKNYNPAAGEYTYEITWVIKRTPIALLRNRGLTSNEALKQLIDDQNTKFRRVYTHYFTGTNTEVLSARLETNKLYFNKLTRYENLYSNPANSDAINKGENRLDPENKQNVQHIALNPRQGDTLAMSPREYDNELMRQSDEKGRLLAGNEMYVDDVSVASIERLAQFRYMYRFARDNQGSVPLASAPEGAGSKSQEMYDLLRNTRNKLHLSALKLDLEIKGDPYWLSPINGNYEANSGERLSNLKSNVIGFITGFPNEVQEKGIRNDYMFSGMYYVTNVTSSFNSGKFTQKLECARINDVDGGTFLKIYGNQGETEEGEE